MIVVSALMLPVMIVRFLHGLVQMILIRFPADHRVVLVAFRLLI